MLGVLQPVFAAINRSQTNLAVVDWYLLLLVAEKVPVQRLILSTEMRRIISQKSCFLWRTGSGVVVVLPLRRQVLIARISFSRLSSSHVPLNVTVVKGLTPLFLQIFLPPWSCQSAFVNKHEQIQALLFVKKQNKNSLQAHKKGEDGGKKTPFKNKISLLCYY